MKHTCSLGRHTQTAPSACRLRCHCSPCCCTGAQQLQQQLQSSPCVVQSRDSARNSCRNAHLLQTQKDELLGSFSTLATQRWHLTVCFFKWWTEMKIWKYVYIYIHRHIYTHLHVSILYTEVRYILTPQNCFWKLLKIFRTVPTDLIRQLCRVENISKSTLGTCPSKLNQEVLSCWTQRKQQHPQAQQLLRSSARKQSLAFKPRGRWSPSLPP